MADDELKEYGYSLRDVDQALYNVLLARNFAVVQDNKQVRLKVDFGTPDEAISTKRYPCILIEPGFNVHTPQGFYRDDRKEFTISPSNNQNVVEATERTIDVFYDYRLSYLLLYQAHVIQMEMDFMRLFPLKFLLDVADAQANKYRVGFRREEVVEELDEYVDNQKVYRRDCVLTAHLFFTNTSLAEFVRAWKGVDIQVSIQGAE